MKLPRPIVMSLLSCRAIVGLSPNFVFGLLLSIFNMTTYRANSWLRRLACIFEILVEFSKAKSNTRSRSLINIVSKSTDVKAIMTKENIVMTLAFIL